ncbi:Copper binding protein, plastocyanin/azurin family [Serinicoccus hydrothermalis]|uniref:Copper binding protein, plastocyanin/azurin family n=1 Tax=Serinicoccus hydrothermalis TaxID=1758689 RepID=A0A1B1NBC2_9MICO|nr:cell wall-binding repeat-containing protein [Serinicoccus hydrothermalis]ANS78694.1 Copper binding protein, plastocyanin/azurin family [Serinicoccus hydrothermalis]
MLRAPRRALSALVVLVLLGATPALAAEEAPEAAVEVDRVSGHDRYATAARVAEQFDQVSDTVFLANGEDWAQGADAVAAGAAAGSGVFPDLVEGDPGEPSPVLLTRATGLPAATRAALEERAPSQAVVLGGPGVILPAVDQELLEMGITPVRAFGRSRYGTAAVLSTAFGPGVEQVYVASGEATFEDPPYPPMMPDALAASARAGAEDAPVLLTRRDTLPPETRAALEALEPAAITIVGGENGVSLRVALELAEIAPTTRVKGTTRYETAAALFEGYDPGGRTYVASGEFFADSLAVSALAAAEGSSLLLVRKPFLTSATERALLSLDPTAVRVIGGPGVILEAVLDDIRRLLDGDR